MRADLLHVVTTISNPVRYSSRYRLYERFVQQMFQAGVTLTTVELTYGDRPSMVRKVLEKVGNCAPASARHRHVHLRTRTELWHKENLVDIGVAHLPADAEYIAWIDADVTFQRPNWAAETVHSLQTYDVVQMFSQALDLSPEFEVAPPPRVVTSFLASYEMGATSANGRYDDHLWHPGYAWAMRRSAYRAVGGLIDFAVLGAGDRHMAMALVGKADASMPRDICSGYRQRVLAWQELAEEHVQHNVGYVTGLITHGWHGRKRQRGYHDRWKILVEQQYDPTTDIKYDPTTGLLDWSHMRSDRMRRLRNQVRYYFRSRNEDSIDVD